MLIFWRCSGLTGRLAIERDGAVLAPLRPVLAPLLSVSATILPLLPSEPSVDSASELLDDENSDPGSAGQYRAE